MFNKFIFHLKRATPTILSCIGAAGVIATAVMAVRDTPKALKMLSNSYRPNDEELSLIEKAKIVWPCYIPAAGIGLATIGCILGANVLNRKQQATLASAYIFLHKSYREYKEKVKQLIDENKIDEIDNALLVDRYKDNLDIFSPSGDKKIFYEEYYGKFFERSMEDVLRAEYHFNRNFILRGYADLNEFYKFLNLPETEIGKTIGWGSGIGFEEYGYSWVDFEHRLIKIEDGMECISIEFPFEPTPDFLD